MKKLSGGQEIGTFLIYLFFFAIGVPASLLDIVKNAPLLFGFCAIVVAVNMVFCFLGGKLLRFDLEEIILASNANIGGPTTAVAMAVSKGRAHYAGGHPGLCHRHLLRPLHRPASGGVKRGRRIEQNKKRACSNHKREQARFHF
jgi:hypothetical protein